MGTISYGLAKSSVYENLAETSVLVDEPISISRKFDPGYLYMDYIIDNPFHDLSNCMEVSL